jgi:hypothetical protein
MVAGRWASHIQTSSKHKPKKNLQPATKGLESRSYFYLHRRAFEAHNLKSTTPKVRVHVDEDVHAVPVDFLCNIGRGVVGNVKKTPTSSFYGGLDACPGLRFMTFWFMTFWFMVYGVGSDEGSMHNA